MKNLNLPNKITLFRIILSFFILITLLMPWHQLNFSWNIYYFNGLVIDMKYIFVGILFLVGSITDFLDGYIARKQNLVTDLGKTMDAIADKMLVNGLLIILAYQRVLPVFIPVCIITRDIITDACKSVCGSKGKVVAASKLGKIKTAFIMIGLTLVLFYDLPFSLVDLYVGEIFLFLGTLLSIISGVEYVTNSLPYINKK
ncbi:MAG: CDP-diacylglycerol--glycerol-3-phosphate 3-phosphatidyltransferase [bacterium]